MAKFPGAKWRPLPENATQGKIVPTQLIYHSAVDAPGPTDLWKYFDSPDVKVESHFFVHLDGSCDQFMDTEVMADANLGANIRAISVETEDDGNSELPWSPAQMVTLRNIAIWAHTVHGVPLVACPAWDAPGIGYHSMWGFKDNRNLTGPIANPWSPSLGKTCPGKVRVAQFWGELLPSLTKEDVHMDAATAHTFVNAVYQLVLRRNGDPGGLDYWAGMLVNGMSREEFLWNFITGAAPELEARADLLATIANDVAALKADVAALKSAPAVSADVNAVLAAIAKKLGG